jgi:type 1 glutamine amidotransferase
MSSTMRTLSAAALVIIALISSSVASASDQIKVLLISGQNNHNWRVTTPLIVSALKVTERFEVVVCNEIEKMNPKALSDFDVIVSNWNLWKLRKAIPVALQWSDELKAAYVDFVKLGGGHVAIHAGSSTFYDCSDYQEICVATWAHGTHHGPCHEFEVRIDTQEHPVTKGLANFNKWDELWEKVHVSAEDYTVLTSSYASSKFRGDDVWEPSTFVAQFGQGRTAYTSFGHAPKAFESHDFNVLLARLVEWTATGAVTIPAR